jgi:hypothetical protein
MNFSLFPKQEYWLTSPLAPDMAENAIRNDIYQWKNKGVFDFVDEFVDNTTRTFRYFVGSVGQSRFVIRRNYDNGRKIYDNYSDLVPTIKGEIIQSNSGSSIHVVSTTSLIYQIYSHFVAAVLIGIASICSIWLGICFCAFLIGFRYDYLRRSKGDKKELIEILKAEEIKKPIDAL